MFLHIMNKSTFPVFDYIIRNFSVVIVAVSFTVLLFSSCTVSKPTGYFNTLKKDTTLSDFAMANYESKIIKGDKLGIVVSSSSPVEDALFNGTTNAVIGNSGTSYTVQEDGTIVLHRIGKIKAEGFTRKEFSKKIEDKLQDFMKEPIVQVTYLNHKITVIGEVSRPQVLILPEEQISLIDALALSGDVKPTASIHQVKVIREEGITKKVKILNLEDNSLFSSPWYYVKPNDIIVVGIDNEKTAKVEKRQNRQTNLSLLVTTVSLLLIILDRVIK